MQHAHLENGKSKGLNLFRLWSAGLVNRLISFENAICIGALTGNPVLVSNDTEMYVSKKNELDGIKKLKNYKQPRFSDLLDSDSFQRISFTDQDFGKLCSDEVEVDNFFNNYVSCNGEDDPLFSEGRNIFVLDKNNNYNFKGTLGLYSIIFLNRPKYIDSALSRLSFKKEYVQAASYIADKIGSFKSAHIRGTDHRPAHSLSTDRIFEELESFSNDEIFVLTDEPDLFIGNKKYILIDRFILQEFESTIDEIGCDNSTVFDLINLLVAGESIDFIGTQGSTFSGYINRLVAQNNDYSHSFKYFGINSADFYGARYSWNNFTNLDSGVKLWWMEWPESRLYV